MIFKSEYIINHNYGENVEIDHEFMIKLSEKYYIRKMRNLRELNIALTLLNQCNNVMITIKSDGFRINFDKYENFLTHNELLDNKMRI